MGMRKAEEQIRGGSLKQTETVKAAESTHLEH